MLPRCLLSLLCALLPIAAGTLHAADSLPFQFRDGMVWVKVAVSGQSRPLNFLLDSGAGRSVIDLATARRLGLKLGSAQPVLGVGGQAVAYPVKDFDARASGVPIASSLLALDLSNPSRACHQRIEGLIGAYFFREHIVQVDYAAQLLRLLSRSEMNATRGERLPLVKRNDALCTRISVEGHASECFRLDTGCNSALEWVAPTARSQATGVTTIGLQSAGIREGRTTVEIGGISVPGVKTGVHAKPLFPGEAGLIGNGLLSRFTVTFDAGKGTCIVSER